MAYYNDIFFVCILNKKILKKEKNSQFFKILPIGFFCSVLVVFIMVDVVDMAAVVVEDVVDIDIAVDVVVVDDDDDDDADADADAEDDDDDDDADEYADDDDNDDDDDGGGGDNENAEATCVLRAT